MKDKCCSRDKTCKCGEELLLKNGGFTLKALIDNFKNVRLACFEKYLEYYRKDSGLTLDEAVKRATQSKYENGIMHHHQRRIGAEKLAVAYMKLKGVDFSEVTSFDELHSLVRDNLKSISGIGILAYYDIAHRIGVFCELKPQKVYLHAGVKEGAKNLKNAMNLKIDCSKGTLEMNELPSEFNQLTPDKVEDFLCIYKEKFLKKLKF